MSSEPEDVLDYIYEVLWIEVGSFLRKKLAPAFWSCFKNTQFKRGASEASDEQQYKLFTNFVNAVKSLDAYYQFVKSSLEKLDAIRKISDHNQSLAKLNDHLRSSLLSQLPTHFSYVVFSFYSVSFRVFFNIHQTTSMNQGKWLRRLAIKM